MWHHPVNMTMAYLASFFLMLQISRGHRAFQDFLTSAPERKMKIVEMHNNMLIACLMAYGV